MENMFKTLNKFVIVILSLFCLFFLVIINKRDMKVSSQQKIIDSLNNRIIIAEKTSDSLSMELFPLEIELGRYEVAYQIFMERNPKAASEYGTIISNETE